MPWSSIDSVPQNLKRLGLRWANRWAEVYDRLTARGTDSNRAAAIAWNIVREERERLGLERV